MLLYPGLCLASLLTACTALYCSVQISLGLGLPFCRLPVLLCTARAGRDGREAECLLYYYKSDAASMRTMITKSAQENNSSADALKTNLDSLNTIVRACMPLIVCVGSTVLVCVCMHAFVCVGGGGPVLMCECMHVFV